MREKTTTTSNNNNNNNNNRKLFGSQVDAGMLKDIVEIYEEPRLAQLSLQLSLDL